MRKRWLGILLSGALIFSAVAEPMSASGSDFSLPGEAGEVTESVAEEESASEENSGGENLSDGESASADESLSDGDAVSDGDEEADSDVISEEAAAQQEPVSGEEASPEEEEVPVQATSVNDPDDDGLSVGDMRINLLSEPFGVSADALYFSWSIDSDQNDTAQTAYRIVIAQTAEQIAQEAYVYDTGWVESDSNTNVLTAMDAAENQLYYWQVQIRDNHGRTSELSAAQAFSTAVGSEWNASKGIWTGTDDFVFLRSETTVDMSDVEKVIFTATAISPEDTRQYVYNLYLNGECVGMGPSRVNGGGALLQYL